MAQISLWEAPSVLPRSVDTRDARRVGGAADEVDLEVLRVVAVVRRLPLTLRSGPDAWELPI